MTKHEIRDAVFAAITITLQRSGRSVPDFKDTDKPVDDYDGFDSQCGVEVTLELEGMLRADDLGTNIFVKGQGKAARARTIKEIVNHVAALILTKGGQR